MGAEVASSPEPGLGSEPRERAGFLDPVFASSPVLIMSHIGTEHS